MYAIIDEAGKQFKVTSGDTILIDRAGSPANSSAKKGPETSRVLILETRINEQRHLRQERVQVAHGIANDTDFPIQGEIRREIIA